MKIKEGFVIREIAGNTIAVATGEAAREFSGMISVNETGRLLFERLCDGADEQQLVDALLEGFDVTPQAAAADVAAFIAKLKDANILE